MYYAAIEAAIENNQVWQPAIIGKAVMDNIVVDQRIDVPCSEDRMREGESMSKKIVFCADGTWDGTGGNAAGPGEGHPPAQASACTPQLSNVCKLFAWLSGSLTPAGASWGGAEMEKSLADASGAPMQIAKYIHGVGDTRNVPDHIVEGTFGVGVLARIARGYTYISRNYQPGDGIVIVGFSRGAYTARALAGLIAGQGLLKPALAQAGDASRFDTAMAAWYRWRLGRDGFLGRWVDRAEEAIQTREIFSKGKPLTDDSFVPVKISAVAVWDTVGALGIPVYKGGATLDLFRFCDTRLSPNIALGFQALALDEEREPYTPTLWDPSPAVTQALFPGGHADIGGGYAEHGLSDGPLEWMLERLQHADVGLRFDPQPPCEVQPDPTDFRHREWVADAKWKLLGVAPRKFPAAIPVDSSVAARMAAAPEKLFGGNPAGLAYAPVLPGG